MIEQGRFEPGVDRGTWSGLGCCCRRYSAKLAHLSVVFIRHQTHTVICRPKGQSACVYCCLLSPPKARIFSFVRKVEAGCWLLRLLLSTTAAAKCTRDCQWQASAPCKRCPGWPGLPRRVHQHQSFREPTDVLTVVLTKTHRILERCGFLVALVGRSRPHRFSPDPRNALS